MSGWRPVPIEELPAVRRQLRGLEKEPLAAFANLARAAAVFALGEQVQILVVGEMEAPGIARLHLLHAFARFRSDGVRTHAWPHERVRVDVEARVGIARGLGRSAPGLVFDVGVLPGTVRFAWWGGGEACALHEDCLGDAGLARSCWEEQVRRRWA